eukprot:TRINITY_DN1338_c0_g1_i3.p1 TRINITY_DN1338_c0_g1~~TRINITY_DN1338_c0_g1_i3.p1  ORF type:complete len:433 (-),score=75.65 TRINITY_DN1338_c0_g1_i3:299-1597(-)
MLRKEAMETVGRSTQHEASIIPMPITSVEELLAVIQVTSAATPPLQEVRRVTTDTDSRAAAPDISTCGLCSEDSEGACRPYWELFNTMAHTPDEPAKQLVVYSGNDASNWQANIQGMGTEFRFGALHSMCVVGTVLCGLLLWRVQKVAASRTDRNMGGEPSEDDDCTTADSMILKQCRSTMLMGQSAFRWTTPTTRDGLRQARLDIFYKVQEVLAALRFDKQLDAHLRVVLQQRERRPINVAYIARRLCRALPDAIVAMRCPGTVSSAHTASWDIVHKHLFGNWFQLGTTEELSRAAVCMVEHWKKVDEDNQAPGVGVVLRDRTARLRQCEVIATCVHNNYSEEAVRCQLRLNAAAGRKNRRKVEHALEVSIHKARHLAKNVEGMMESMCWVEKDLQCASRKLVLRLIVDRMEERGATSEQFAAVRKACSEL